MRSSPALALVILAAVAACTGPRGPAGSTGSSCTVEATDAGNSVISCPDGTMVAVANSQPGTACTITTADGGGGKTITCADGTSVTIASTDAGSSCSVGESDAGLEIITCTDGTSSVVSPPPTAPSNVVATTDDLPGLVVEVVSLSGASGPGGDFEIGDTVSATFTARTSAGADLPLGALDQLGIWIAGPTSGYQRVLPTGRDQLTLADVATRATRNADGSYTYKFASPLPGTFGPPLYDTAKFTVGELTGQPLQHGTYTLALSAMRAYHVGVETVPDVGADTRDFLLGTATALEPREVVTLGNCNSCHVTLQAHGGAYRDPKLCVTCHTAGAEDVGSTDTNDATPVTIELSILLHKIHNGASLPSVLGVGVNADGTASYAAPPRPYVVGGAAPDDFSNEHFSAWPSLTFPMPRNKGYSALAAAQQATDDQIRSGVVACAKCHGDPDGAGPLPAPAQGQFAFEHLSRGVCGSCHDDIDWTKPWKRNTDTGMTAQLDDSKCLVCHPSTGFAVGGSPQHVHPMLDPTFDKGLKVALSNVHEAGTNDGNGKLDVGEKLAVTINVTDDSGTAIAAASLPSLSVVVTGPTANRNLLVSSTIPAAALSGAGPWTLDVPDAVNLERLGASTAATGDVFTTQRTPVWNVTGATPTLFVRTGSSASTTLAASAPALQNFVDVVSAVGFARNDYLVVDDGVAGLQEYLRVQWIDGNRLWFAAAGAAGYQPGLRAAHAAAATVTKVTLAAKVLGTDYSLATSTGTLTELTEFGAGAIVLATYTTDFVVPAVYGPPLNESPDLGQDVGKWKGLPLAPGTYTVGVWGSQTLTLAQNGETTSYRASSTPATVDFLVGAATTIAPVSIVASSASCQACHVDVYGHGGSRRGLETCLLCHGSAGGEDRPRYVAAAAPATPGLSIEFRAMLHKIHRGSDLPDADTYTVVGFGAGAYPNNFGLNTYSDVEFPAMPSGVKDCRACHGASDAWQTPADRSHPTDATTPARSWTVACGSCHSSSAAVAHIAVNTTGGGVEACAVCHGAGADLATDIVHRVR